MQKGSNRTIRTVTKMRIAYISPKAFISLLVMQFSLFKLTKLSSTLTQHALYSDSIVRTISKGPMNFTRASSRQCLSEIGVSRLSSCATFQSAIAFSSARLHLYFYRSQKFEFVCVYRKRRSSCRFKQLYRNEF